MASGEGCLRLVVARPASALSSGRWVVAVTPPRVSAAAGQPTPATSATSVRMAAGSGTAVAARQHFDFCINFSYVSHRFYIQYILGIGQLVQY